MVKKIVLGLADLMYEEKGKRSSFSLSKRYERKTIILLITMKRVNKISYLLIWWPRRNFPLKGIAHRNYISKSFWSLHL